MKRTLTLVFSAIIFCTAITAIAQTDSISRTKVERINPYHSIKTSVFIEKSFGDYVKSGTAVGLEVRKFTGLRHFFFLTTNIGQYHGHDEYRTSLNQSYDLTFKSVKVRVGTVLGKELYNFYVGTHYIFDARLSESFYSLDQNRQVTVSGN